MTRKPASRKRRVRGSGSLFEASSGVWIARKRMGGRLVERRAPTAVEALAKLAAVSPPSDSTTVSAWLARWLASMQCRPATKRSRNNSVNNYLTPTLGHLRLAELRPYHIEEAVTVWVKAEKAAGTVKLVLSHLSTAVRSAMRSGLRADNPVSLAKRPKVPRTKIDPFTIAELKLIVAEAARRGATRIIALLATTGMRSGEALALDVPDWEPVKATVTISKTLDQSNRTVGPPKTENSNRTIRVPGEGVPVVCAAAGKRRRRALFLSHRGVRTTYKNTRAAWYRLLGRLKLRTRPMHEMRHSCASLMVANGVPIGDIARYLGDSVETIVKVYIHSTGTDPSAALDRLFSGASVGQTS